MRIEGDLGGSLWSSFLKRLRYQSGADVTLMQCFSRRRRLLLDAALLFINSPAAN